MAFDRSLRPARMAPLGAGDISPPLGDVAFALDRLRHHENHGTGFAHIGRKLRVSHRIDFAFGHRDIPCGFHEATKFFIGDFGTVDPETIDLGDLQGLLFGIDVVAQLEAAARHPLHASMR